MTRARARAPAHADERERVERRAFDCELPASRLIIEMVVWKMNRAIRYCSGLPAAALSLARRRAAALVAAFEWLDIGRTPRHRKIRFGCFHLCVAHYHFGAIITLRPRLFLTEHC